MRTLLLRRLAPVLLLAAIAASACSSVERRAATVDGESISADSVQDELKVIRGNKRYREALESPNAYGVALAGEGKGTFDSSFVAQLLTLRVYYELVEQSLEDLGVEVTGRDEKDARGTVKEQIGSLGKGVWEGFPEKYKALLTRQYALIAVAQQAATDGPIAKRYFAAHKDEFAQACVSHILVSTENRSEADAKARAEELKARLAGGADFAALANTDSDDPGAKETSGDLDCGAKGRFVEEFDEAVFSLPIGEVSDPVQTQFGYHLILVRSRSAATFEEAGPSLSEQAWNDYLFRLTCGKGVDVDIDPRYGTWDRSPCKDRGGLPTIDAPAKPASDSTPEGENTEAEPTAP